MNDTIQIALKNLPTKPGVYQFKDAGDNVIYVGKAKNLRNRVRSYFQSNITSPKTATMVKRINDLEVIITDNEIEALVLENNLIKEYKPRYNVDLKDDKSFPFIKVTNEHYPRIYPTRNIVRDGSKYFGPYTEVRSMRAALRMINRLFRIRSCKLVINDESIREKKHKVCLDYHIKKCDGPCEGLISEEDYQNMVNRVIKLLRGRTDELIRELNSDMEQASENLDFEKAAELRDKIGQLSSLSEKQKMVTNDSFDRDVFAVSYEANDAACSIFTIRAGKFIAKKTLRPALKRDDSPAYIYSAVIKQYYNNLAEIPQEIVLETEPDDAEVISEWLSEKSERKVKITIPQRGVLKSLLTMCKENARLQLKEIQLQKMKKEGNIPYTLSALQRDLRLKMIPKRIECFDISHLQGSDTVASLVVFVDGKPKKKEYRKFIIKDSGGEPDDFKSMREVIERRYTRIMNENGEKPELIMVDGGKGQLSSAVTALENIGYEYQNIIGLAKRLEEVFLPGESEPVLLPKTSSALKLLQQIRDEAHRFAVTFHRQRRDKRTLQTGLTQINGIGKATAEKLLKEFGSLKRIKTTNFDELKSVVGKQKALAITEHYQSEKEQ